MDDREVKPKWRERRNRGCKAREIEETEHLCRSFRLQEGKCEQSLVPIMPTLFVLFVSAMAAALTLDARIVTSFLRTSLDSCNPSGTERIEIVPTQAV